VGKKGAVLVGGWFRELLDLSERQLARIGWRTVPASHTMVDRHDLCAVIAPARLELVGAALDARYPRDEHTLARDGRYAITAVIVAGNEPNPSVLGSPSQRLAALLPLLGTGSRRIERRDVEWLMGFAGRVEIDWLFGLDDRELLDRLFRLAGRTPKPAFTLPR
jgi:hypothetical protein